MIAGSEAIIAGAGAITTACALLQSARARLAVSVDELLERDHRETPRPTRCVLVLDDERAPRDATAHALLALGVPILTASTAAEARVAIRRARPSSIVADYHLGEETCLALLRDRPAYCRAVIVTGRVDLDALAPLARAVGADLRGRPLDAIAAAELVALVRAGLPE